MADERSSTTSTPFTVAIIGGGLVGSLAAMTLAKRGWFVELYELRKDPRKENLSAGRSINLALSVRGISALENAGIAEGILETLLPMRGRMIHSTDGALSAQLYGLFGECINSVDRKFLNEHLLTEAEKLPNVALHFEHAIQSCDFDQKTLVFKKMAEGGSLLTVKADLIVGTDGAYSKVRSQLMRAVRMDFSQEYIDHAYVELNIPPTETGDYAMDPHHLHIWPRHTFMMIALPNRDKSFTVTLFMPWCNFDGIKTEADLLEFFTSTFPDSVPLLGEKNLVHDFFKNPKGALVTIKCKPYYYRDRIVILGDSAHAMVPFYGQGMNCGFEDVLVLDEILQKHLGKVAPASPTTEYISLERPTPKVLEAVLEEYSKTRNPDAEAMCDLAMYNYIEMRSSVVDPGYLFRKKVEGFLHKLFPSVVIPLYTMVSFTRIPYSQAMARWKKQTTWFETLRLVAGTLSFAAVWGVVGLVTYKKLRV